ncbi:acetate kinase [Myxococcota bacterium]|nr:acetate kinase [Myxococcota bacterium]
MRILVINSGSSSIKYQLFQGEQLTVAAKGLIEKIGLEMGKITHKGEGGTVTLEEPIPGHEQGISLLLGLLCRPGGELASMAELTAVGHRVVHGGEHHADATIITPAVLETIRECTSLAPLHNPPNLAGIEAVASLLPDIPQVAVFDTAFHQTMPPEAYLYGLPQWVYEKHKIRKYGFHGSSHDFVSTRAAQLLDRPVESLNLITCHLGNGSSMCAIEKGKSVDTSMGFTPLDGLLMGPRTGTMDPAIVLHLERLGYTIDHIDRILNKESGLLGVSGVSSDMRDLQSVMETSADARLALTMFARRVKQFIGSYIALLGNLDALIFTGGIGENDAYMRMRIASNLEGLGIRLDPEANEATVRGKEGPISCTGALPVLVVPTNEESFIAQKTRHLTR